VAVTNILAIHGLIDPGGILNGPSWSISTEIFAYLVFATTQFLCRSEAKLGLASLAIVIGSLGILGSVGRLQSLDLIADYSFFRCTTGFFVGVITRLVLQRTRRASAKLSAMAPPGALVGASLLAMIGFLSLKSRGQSDFWMIPGVAILIWLVASSPKNRVNEALEASWLSWLGKVSYSIYMVHWGVALIFSAALKALGTPTRHLADLGRDILDPGPAPGLLCLVLFVGTVLALSHVTFHLIEEPFRLRSRRLAERWFAR
jgi:peptidoglycan/LPS O-acetylase OafA/YrhL